MYEATPPRKLLDWNLPRESWIPRLPPKMPAESTTDLAAVVKQLKDMQDAASPANPKKIHGDAKPQVQLVPPALTLEAAQALAEGAEKYGAYKWREVKVEAMTYVGAMLRHLYAWLDGEDTDPDSTTGKSHLAGVAGSLAILLDARDGGTLIDNRPTKCNRKKETA